MDFWTRLVANTPLSSRTSRKDAAKDPVKRRQRFEKEYSQLLSTWRNASNLSKDVEAAENIEIRLQELTSMLVDESRRPLPHPCISFCSRKQIYMPIAKIATSSYNEWIIREAVLFFATLIESEEEAFVETETFSSSLTNLLVRITGANSIRLGDDTEVRVVELAFNITTKIRLEPHILPAWFKLRGDVGTQDDKFKDERERFAGRTQKEDFPLFYLLMDYIHHEGKMGDFARTGLLYIIEAASNSVELEQWIVESDLSTLMATGLGALYSQLSRKLVVDHPLNDLPPVLALSDYQHPESTFEIVSSCSPDFRLHLETFLSHLLFWQDVLNHCRSSEIRSTLLEHFQVIFLQQLLYPSLLESSDVDGGSSVAVLTYLRRILESLDHPDMINLILHYLLALPEGGASATSVDVEPSVSAARKRKSMDLATMMATRVEPEYTPLLFNLVDLIQSCLKSPNQQTVCVTLQLLAAILKRHHRYAIITLLHTEGVLGSASQRTIGAHQQEVEFLMNLAESVGGQDDFDELYDTILKDTMTRVEGHPCSIKLVTPKVSTNNHRLPAIPDSLPGAPQDVPPHTLSPHDPLLNNVLDLLESFFINPVEINLSITETILDMAVCGFISVEGWLLRHPTKYQFDEDSSEPTLSSHEDVDPTKLKDVEELEAVTRCRRRPKWQPSALPRVLSILESLSSQADSFRSSIPRFEELLQQRREAFQTADAVIAAPPSVRAPSKATTDQTSVDGSRSGSPARPSGIEGFAQRILNELSSTPSRSGSPRGQREASRASRSLSTPSKPLPQKPLPTPPKEFPLNLEDPSQSGFMRPSTAAATGPGHEIAPAERASPVMLDAAAFAAMDQEILTRRVTLPIRKVAPIPLNFKKDIPKVVETNIKEEGVEEGVTDVDTGSRDVKAEDVETEAVKLEDANDGAVKEEHVEEPIKEEAKEEVKEEVKDTDAAVGSPQADNADNKDGNGEEVKSQDISAPTTEPARDDEHKDDVDSSKEERAQEDVDAAANLEEQEPEQEQPNEAEEEQEEGESMVAPSDVGTDAVPPPPPPKEKTASVSHILTNTIIFQSFLLELTALVQVRAGLFNEVRFT